MAGHSSRSGRKSKKGRGQNLEAEMFSGVVVRDSFSIVETAKSEAGFTVYKTRFKLTVRNSEGFHITEEHEIQKRFSEFQSLSRQLEVIHVESGSTMKFPALVKAKYFERFKETVIQERKKSAVELLDFISRYPHLSQSSHFHLFIASSKCIGPVGGSTPSNNHLPIAPDSLNLTPSPLSRNSEAATTASGSEAIHSSDTILSPDAITIREEESLSVGYSVKDKDRDSSIGLTSRSSLNTSSSTNLEPSSDTLAPVSDISALSGGSSVGSNVSLEILEVDSSLVVPKREQEKSGETTTSSSVSSNNSSSSSLEQMAEVKGSSPVDGKLENASTSVGISGEVGGGGGGGVSGMTWWTSAVAEADNVSDDLDAMVDKVEESTPKIEPKGVVGRQWPVATTGRGSHPGSTPSSRHSSRQSSRHSSHQGSPVLPRRVSPSAQRESAYAVQAGRLIAQALEYESVGDYEEAFDLMKAGVDVLLNGVQTDQNKDRREVVRRKTSEYLLYAENLQKKLSTRTTVKTDAASSTTQQESDVSKEPPVPAPPPAKPHHLQDFKVKAVLGKVMLVESRHTGQQYIFKVLHKSLKAMASVPRGAPKTTKNRAPSQSPYIVKLLHFYETPNHRIFLLLEYVQKGKLLDYVVAKREQWRKLKEAATNPPPSSSLLSSKERTKNVEADTEKREVGSEKSLTQGKSKDAVAEEKNGESKKEESFSGDKGAEGNDVHLVASKSSVNSEMEKMLSELTSIVPPNTLPSSDSITSQDTDRSSEEQADKKTENGGDEEVLDSLAIMRKRLEESMQETDQGSPSKGSNRGLKIELSKAESPGSVKDCRTGDDDDDDDEEDFEVIDTTIRVLPPTPTVTRESVGNGDLKMTSFPVDPMNSLVVGTSHDVVGFQGRSLSVMDGEKGGEKAGGDGDGKKKESVVDQGTFFTPSTMQSTDKRVDDWSQRLEQSVQRWAAQIVLALEHLHNQNVICRDLHPGNILINESGNAVLTYFGKWDFVEDKQNLEMARRFYMAPELQTLSAPSAAVDWWCLGAILFELLTGKSLMSCLPGGTHSHLPLPLPVPVSSEAKSLLTQLLQISPAERLGSGPAGVEEVKAHPFFAGINWRNP